MPQTREPLAEQLKSVRRQQPATSGERSQLQPRQTRRRPCCVVIDLLAAQSISLHLDRKSAGSNMPLAAVVPP